MWHWDQFVKRTRECVARSHKIRTQPVTLRRLQKATPFSDRPSRRRSLDAHPRNLAKRNSLYLYDRSRKAKAVYEKIGARVSLRPIRVVVFAGLAEWRQFLQ